MAPAQPVLAQDEPPIQPTVVIPDTGDADIVVQDDEDNFIFNNWWLLVLIGVGLIGLIIGLLARSGSHHHHVE
jgi:hypothetical protein